jgi:ferredoxin-NADP reductase
VSRLRASLRVLEGIATPHGLDRYLELVHPMLALRELRAVITDVTPGPGGTFMITLRPGRTWRGFAAGQYVQIGIDIGGVRHVRCFSPSCSQHRSGRRIELTVKAHEMGRVTPWLRTHARPGQVVMLSQAQGSFQLPTPRPRRVLLISGGSGITPVLSMLRTLVDEQHPGEIVFVHYARGVAEVPHRAELRRIAAAHRGVRVLLAATRTRPGADLIGHFEPAHLAEAAPWYAEAPAFLCGPPGLQAAVRDHYAAKGIADNLCAERFTLEPYVSVDAADGCVRFGDVVVRNSGATLLEQAEAAGLAPAYGCRMGICFTCPKVKLSGCTRDIRSGDLHTEPDTAIQLCVSVPVGDVAIEL